MRTAADIIAEIAYDAYWDNLIDADETIRRSEWVVFPDQQRPGGQNWRSVEILEIAKITVDILETI